MLKEEMETIIRFDKSSNTASVYTADPTMIRKLKKFQGFDNVILIQEDEYAIQMDIPKKWIRITKSKSRNLTEEQKQASIQHLRKARAAKLITNDEEGDI